MMAMLLRFYQQHNKPASLTPLVTQYLKANPEAAEVALLPVATAQDGVAEVLYTMGGIMLGAEVNNDAIVYLQLALYVKPDFPDAAAALGDGYAQLQQYSRSNEAYARVPVTSRLYTKAQLHSAVNLDRMGEHVQALNRLDAIARQAPDGVSALIMRGDLLRIHNDYQEAINAYSQAIAGLPKLKPLHWPILFARGACYERLGKWEEAERDLRQALELKPDQPDVLNYLAYGLLERGQNLPEAQTMLEQAVKSRPNDAQIVDSMGWSLYLQGDYQAATAFLKKAVELLPGDPTVNDHLGDVYWRLGRKNEARFQWERSLSFAPEDTLVDRLNHKLKTGLPAAKLANTAAQAAIATP